MQTLKSLILKLDGARPGCCCTPQISFPYSRMCHLFRFSFLPWWKCPVQSQGQLQNVWDFILPRVRSGNLGQMQKWSSLSGLHRRGLIERLSVLPLICETAQSKTTNIHLASPFGVWSCGFALSTAMCFGSLILPSVIFLLKVNLNLHYIIKVVKRFLKPILLFSASL